MTIEGRRIEIRGTVQGVGFRPWVYRVARDLGLSGRVLNGGLGVRVEAFGEPERLDALIATLRGEAPGAAQVVELEWQTLPLDPPPPGVTLDGFVIAASQGGAERRPSIPPDLATCPECLAEVLDPSNRRHRYAFTNCTHCGPRFTIARDVPYDRRATTMASFTMCSACRSEYEWVADRRFHAQPNACPDCGPSLALWGSEGREKVDDVLAEASAQLQAGRIVAIKGLGGFHLACDATRDDVVRELRRRKRRDEKPFAVMVVDLAAARRLAEIDDESAALLESVERPIVLVPRRAGSPGETHGVAEAVAPGVTRLGLMLPYTPLHHVLLREVGLPLVMTSGNVSDAPIATSNREAFERLGAIADAFVVHDRPIENRADDSVATVLGGAPVVLRRSRGYVPRPVRLGTPTREPILAVGGDLKNAFCLASGDLAFFGPHIGDLEDVSTFESFVAAVERLERFVGIRPRIVAHDLHPRYHSTGYARARARAAPSGDEIEAVGVQHHHAHVVSVAAEHGVSGPVLGLAWDGTGYGTDGTAWGGELLLVDGARHERVATVKPMVLPGGDVAIRQVWRLALAALDDAFDGRPPALDRLRVFDHVAPKALRGVRQMVDRQVNCPSGRGIGRVFDAIGALVLGRPTASFEGQIAMAWEQACAGAPAAVDEGYEVGIDWSVEPWALDFRPALRLAIGDHLDGCGAGVIAARFHGGLVAAAVELVDAAARRHGRLPVALSGGCFQNAVLVEALLDRLSGRFDILLQRSVPPNDGGLALGQVVIADALAARGDE